MDHDEKLPENSIAPLLGTPKTKIFTHPRLTLLWLLNINFEILKLNKQPTINELNNSDRDLKKYQQMLVDFTKNKNMPIHLQRTIIVHHCGVTILTSTTVMNTVQNK